eukprot:3257751-Amphidinium_carterae.1
MQGTTTKTRKTKSNNNDNDNDNDKKINNNDNDNDKKINNDHNHNLNHNNQNHNRNHTNDKELFRYHRKMNECHDTGFLAVKVPFGSRLPSGDKVITADFSFRAEVANMQLITVTHFILAGGPWLCNLLTPKPVILRE